MLGPFHNLPWLYQIIMHSIHVPIFVILKRLHFSSFMSSRCVPIDDKTLSSHAQVAANSTLANRAPALLDVVLLIRVLVAAMEGI